MKRSLIVCALFATSALALEDATYPKIVTAKTLYAKNDLRGKKAPAFVVEKWLNGDAPSMKGKVLFVDFWATWCGPCRALIPEVNEWNKKYGKDVVFVGVSDEDAATVSKFMKDTPMDYHVAVDTQKRMSKELGVQGIPHVMIVSPDGIVRWQGFPGSEEDTLTDKVLEQVIAASKAKR
ncbi:MAG: TlpA family protein disulfide reductase [Armatimonadetes bacterium]|nr:TlpA family protein disulfide reductase [Armatimonadota bacterium]